MSTCEDFPCCGHEAGDCDGSLYGSDESIKARVEEDWRNGHGYCDHAEGIFNCEGGDEPECEDDEHDCQDCENSNDGWRCSWCERECPVGEHETPEERNARLNAEAANRAHDEGRHTPGAGLQDKIGWAKMGCTRCSVDPGVTALLPGGAR